MDGETLTERVPEVVSSSVMKNTEDAQEILSPFDIQTIANRAWNDDVKILRFEIQPYSNKKLGFLGLHKCLKISVSRKNAKEVESKQFFLKCIPPNNEILTKALTELGVFEQEISFYSEVMPLLDQYYKAEQWAPKCYLITKEAMVLEDLRVNNFSIRNKMLTKEETISALSAIARMHAASILTEKGVGKPLNKIAPIAFNLRSFYSDTSPRTMWYHTGIALIKHLAESMGLDSSNIKECCETWLKVIEPAKDQFNVITHSDLWSNNIMFDNSSPPKSVLVDFQMSRYCPFPQDVIVFLYLCTTRAFREVHQTEMLKHYYNVLIKTLKLHDAHMTVPTWNELLQGVKENTPCAVSIAALYFPLVLIDGLKSAQEFSNPSTYWKFAYVDRKDTVDKLMKEDKEYAERLVETVTELVELSHKLDQYPLSR